MSIDAKYLVLGRQTFRTNTGVQVRGAFNTASAQLFAIPEKLAQRLSADPTSLTSEQISNLENSGVVASAESGNHFNDRLINESTDLAVRTFVLMPTPACNMGCSYCGQIHQGKSLKQGYVDLVAPRILDVIQSPETAEVNVNWFGGEPLLAMKEIVSLSQILKPAADKYNVELKSQLTTNGSLFSPEVLRKLILDGGITRIDVTVDGPKSVHDASRRMKNGSSTYDRILDSLQWLQDQTWSGTCQIGIRTNVVEESIPYIDEMLVDFRARGLGGKNGPMLQIAPVHEWGAGIEAHEPTIARFAAAELRWLEYCARSDLNYLPLPGPSEGPCSAGKLGTETIDPDGYIFDCVEYPLTRGAKVFLSIGKRPPEGSQPRDAGTLDADMPWQRPASGPQCHKCNLYPVCGGACALSRSKGQAHCPSMRYNFEERIDIAMLRKYGDFEKADADAG